MRPKDKIEIQLDARNLVVHRRVVDPEHQRITLPEHRLPRGQGIKRTDPHPEEKAIVEAAPELAGVRHGTETAQAASWSFLPCANCCAWCGSTRATRSWQRSKRQPVTACTTWTASNAWSCADRARVLPARPLGRKRTRADE